MRLTSWEVWWTKFRGALGRDSWLQATPGNYGCLLGRKELHLFFIALIPQFLLQPLIFSYSALPASNLTTRPSLSQGDIPPSFLTEGIE